jgi:hypothetical protein
MSLVAHLSGRFAASAEVIASTSLNYILGRSTEASRGFAEFLRSLAPGIPETLIYRNEVVGADKARPDLEATTMDGALKAVIETKFWAGLTKNQPVTYLKRLPEDGLLLFIVPRQRLSAVWSEIARLCDGENIGLGAMAERAETRHAPIADGRCIAITSWDKVLAMMLEAIPAGETVAQDVAQLRALCDKMDAEAFLPLAPEEISTQALPRRILSLFEIGDELRLMALDAGIASRDAGNLRSGNGRDFTGWYYRLGPAVVWVGCEFKLWAQHGQSPIWLTFSTTNAAGVALARERLGHWQFETPRRYYEDGNLIAIPIRLAAGEEKEIVLQHAYSQLEQICGLLAAEPAGVAAS